VGDDLQDRLDEQLRYYRERAPEYDAWALREGRFHRGPRERARWFADIAKLERALDRFHPSGRVLELAGGTGQWTERLTRYTDDLTVVDAAHEVLELNRQRVGDRARHIQAEMFSWKPDRRYDVVFFSFWLSHVPPERFRQFWDLVRRALASEGRVFFIDNLASPEATALDPEHPGPEEGSVVRHLADGRAFRVWKVLHRPRQLVADLAELGWDATAHRTGHFFIRCEATRSSDG
jgi:ubiquinone/menaquinone biosynthesis C-methylase UbiE